MALEMRSRCEKCEALIEPQHRCFICPAECTYCAHCAEEMGYACQRCNEELVRRPRAKSGNPASDVSDQNIRTRPGS